MCDECKDLVLEQDMEELQESVGDLLIYCDPILISTDNLVEDVQFDVDEFKKGLNDSSYHSGMFTGLINAGFSYKDAIDYIFTKMGSEMNIKITELSCKATVEAAKNAQVAVEKQQL